MQIAREAKQITDQEFKILEYLINKDDMSMKSEELGVLGITDSKKKSIVMTKLKDKNIIVPITKGGRIYTVKFVNNYLLRGIMKVLKENGFVSDFLNNN